MKEWKVLSLPTAASRRKKIIMEPRAGRRVGTE
jgi:hypothetical protein